MKSKPNVVRYVFGCSLNQPIWLQDNELKKMCAKDISLMNKEATYSAGVTSEDDWFVYRGLEEVKILDIPAEIEKLPSNDDYDVLQLYID